MTDRARQFEETKKQLNSLLISAPAALTVTELKRDYHDFIGCPLDYRGLGYTTIEDFIRDIEDVVHISWKNGMMTVAGKADATTQHIAKLVSKQKVNKKKYAVYRPPRRGVPMQWQRSAAAPPPRLANQHLTQQLPQHTRNMVRQFFQYFPKGIKLSDFQEAFSHTFGIFLGVKKFGFNSLEDVLLYLSDVVRMEGHGNEVRVLPVKPIDKNESVKQSEQKSEPTCDNSRTVSEGDSNNNNDRSRSLSAETRPSKGRGRRKSGHTDSSSSSRPVGHISRTAAHEKVNVLVKEIYQVLQNKPAGVWCSRLPYDYCDMHGKAMDFREHGYVSMIDFIASEMSDLVKYMRPVQQGDWKLYDSKLAPPETESEPTQVRRRHASGQSIEDHTRESIQRILELHPQGFPLSTFQDLFKAYTGSSLPMVQLGFRSIEDLCLSFADSVLQLAYSSQGVLMMYPFDAEIPDEGQEEVENHEKEDTSSLSNVVGPGCHYIPEMCPDKDQYVELYVSNIVNPGLFWVILRHKSRSLALETLMDKLDSAYDDGSSDMYQIPDSMVTPGQVCATLFPEDNNWHRGVITGKNDAGFIKVYFVDYGNTSFVQQNTLRYLRNEFLSLPVQAIQCRLANIHPPTGKWKVKSRNRMLELCREKPLVAYVTDVKAQVMSVCLTDTSDPHVDLHLNDLLVREGYAVFKPDAECEQGAIVTETAGVPDYSHVFGWGAKTVPRLPHCVASQSSGEESVNVPGPGGDGNQDKAQEGETLVCYIKWVQVTKDHVLHLINLDRVAYLISAEISNLMWEEDILTSMLRQRRLQVAKRVVSRDENPYLFQELQKYKVRCLRWEGGDTCQFLSLYQLKDVPDMLRVFEHESEELIKSLEEIRDKFDPDSPFWKGQPRVEDKDDAKGDNSTEEQQKALLALQNKRKKILQMLINNPAAATEHVNELNNCEMEILVLKQESEKPTRKKVVNAVAPSTVVPSNPAGALINPRQTAENQRVIQNIMASTTKPIATANIMTKAVTSTSATRTDVSFTGAQPSMFPTMMPGSTLGPVYPTPATSYPGMMGVAGLQGQRLLNPYMMLQAGGLDPAVAALLPQQGLLGTSIPGHQTGAMTSADYGLLPGLLPLLQSLSVGRGTPWPGRGSGS